MPSAKTNRVEPWAFRKPNVRASEATLRAPTQTCAQRAQSVVMATPCGGSHLGCERQIVRERERAAMQRPCCWRAQLSTHLQRRLLWSSVTWLKYRNKHEPQQKAASLSARCLLVAGRSYDVRGDCWTSAPACARTATSAPTWGWMGRRQEQQQRRQQRQRSDVIEVSKGMTINSYAATVNCSEGGNDQDECGSEKERERDSRMSGGCYRIHKPF